jgi:hypothetical protein
MNQHQLPALTRALTRLPSRRDVLRGLAAAGLGLAVLRGSGAADAKKKRKHKKKQSKLQRNEFGCVEVGGKCQGKSANCCSGVCEGKKPKRGKKDRSRCVAHNTAGVCSADTDICTVGQAVLCSPDPDFPCNCTLTSGNAGFCIGAPAQCRVCRKDTDCEAEFGPGAACIVLGGMCAASCLETGGTACATPCANATV